MWGLMKCPINWLEEKTFQRYQEYKKMYLDLWHVPKNVCTLDSEAQNNWMVLASMIMKDSWGHPGIKTSQRYCPKKLEQ